MSILRRPFVVVIIFAIVIVLVGAALNTAPVTVTVEWSTASELNTAGFNLYRGDSPAGPFARVNVELIPASTDPLIGGTYAFTDTQVSAGRTYYYRLEEVQTDGAATDQGVVTVTAAHHLSPLLIAAAVGVLIIVGLLFGRRKAAPVEPSSHV